MDHKYFKEIETTKIVSRMGRFFDIPIDTAPNPDQTFEQLKVQFWNQNVNKIFPQTLLIAVEQVIGQLPECRTWCNLFDKQLLESAPKRALKLAVRTLEHKDSFYQREAHVALYWLYNLVRPTNLRETILALLDIAELRSLYRVSSSNDEGTPFLQVTTSVLIGGGGNKSKYKTHQFSLKNNDALYLFSDGYADQFGGPKGKKFMYKSFKKMFLSIHHKDMDTQLSYIDNTMKDWKMDNKQLDDICVMGVKI